MITLFILLFSFISGLSAENGSGADKSGDSSTSAVLLFAGDAMQHKAQLDRAKKSGKNKYYDYSDCFCLISPEISKADYAVCNLEVPLGGGPSYSGYPNFSAPDAYAESLKDAGFDMMLTANNHCLDSGDKAARRTLTALDNLGIDHIGTYSSSAQRDSLVPFIKEINGIRFGFLNYTYGTNGIEPTAGTEISLIDRKRMAEEIEKTKISGAEIIVVAMHWGLEYVLNENDYQRELADFLVEEGVDIIIGSHPHVVQPMEIRHNRKADKDVLIVYSLGNLISNMSSDDTRGGAMIWATVERDQDGKARFKSAEYDTFFTAKPEGNLKNFQVVPSWLEEKIPLSQKNHYRIFDKSSQEIFDKYNIGVERRKRKNN